MSPTAPTDPHDVAGQRTTLIKGMLAALGVGIALWLAIRFGMPPIAGMQAMADRLAFAVGCSCVAILLCFVLGVEAVSHERLHGPSIDPLAGAPLSRRMQVNLRYLQHTLEQLLLFVPGLLGLAMYCDSAASMRAVVATTVVWIVARFVFWIGYHRGARFRAPGLVGMVQSLLVLLYVCARFAHDVAGWWGAGVVLAIFAGGEIYLVRATSR
jgi:hypothetical protein